MALLFNAFTLAIPRYLIFSYLNIVNTYWIYILPYCASTMGVFLMKQYIDGSVPDTLLEAAKIDGAGQMRIFWQLVVPMVKPCIMTLTLFGFQGIWSTVPDGTIFSESLKTLPTIMTNINAGGIARSGSAMAVTVIMMLPPIIIYLVTQSNVLESMNSAGIKE
ncbi:MAG: carbohydrate ABC transporter permease [Clostridia bacterium]|nr:carbohydrate ABC transporter permease [Clostridia bacterium]